MLRMLSFSQFESHPKVCILTSLKSGSCGIHSFGQNNSRSSFLLHVLLDPPPSPWTKTTSARPSCDSEWTVVKPRGPFPLGPPKSLVFLKVRVLDNPERSKTIDRCRDVLDTSLLSMGSILRRPSPNYRLKFRRHMSNSIGTEL